jgi:hypothetical protein
MRKVIMLHLGILATLISFDVAQACCGHGAPVCFTGGGGPPGCFAINGPVILSRGPVRFGGPVSRGYMPDACYGNAYGTSAVFGTYNPDPVRHVQFPLDGKTRYALNGRPIRVNAQGWVIDWPGEMGPWGPPGSTGQSPTPGPAPVPAPVPAPSTPVSAPPPPTVQPNTPPPPPTAGLQRLTPRNSRGNPNPVPLQRRSN